MVRAPAATPARGGTTYKETEIGLLPTDWGVEPIENLALITTGGRNTQDRVDDGLYPFFVRSQQVERINSYSFDGEAVLTAGDGVGTGKIFHYINGKCDIHQRVYRISNFRDDVSGYYFYLFFSTNFYNRIMQMTAKSSVDSVRREMIAHMLIALPPKHEQQAIAEALSDANALIEGLEALIAKKRAIKQGVFDTLVAPRVDSKWSTFGEMLRYEQPSKYIVYQSKYLSNGSTPVLTAGKTYILGYTSEESGVYTSPIPAIIFDDFTTDCRIVDFPFKIKSSAIKILTVIEASCDLRFVHELLCRTNLAGADHKRHWISEYQNYKIQVPDLTTQKQLSQTMSELEDEIIQLEHRLEKSRQIKQGMMQELLTGRIRLL
jgi:type I restriction enzyme, S subunit